jgi:two-component system cell cycle response regulator DivK
MKKPRILIIEDDRDNMELMRLMMEREGYEVLEAHDGRVGLELARTWLPDLALVDLAMPEVDGWTVIKELKADPATRYIKLVVVTVRSLLEDRLKAQEAGCDAYITKPMSMVRLAEVVAQFLHVTGSTE